MRAPRLLALVVAGGLLAGRVARAALQAGCYVTAAGACRLDVAPFTIPVAPGAALVAFELRANGALLYDFRTDGARAPAGDYRPSRAARDFAATCGRTYTVELVARDTSDAAPRDAGRATGITCPTPVTTPPHVRGQVLPGSRLVLKVKPDRPGKSALFVLAKTNLLDSTADPTRTGGTLRIVTASGDRFDTTYDLPSARWRPIGGPGASRGYKYRDANLASGPIRMVVIRKGRMLKAIGERGRLRYSLGADPNPVQVLLATGDAMYCLSFGGATTFHADRLYRAESAPAPARCPP